MPNSRSAKEICREFGDTDISCKVAKNREARKKKREAAEGTSPPPPPPPPPPPEDTKTEAPKPVTERQKYLDEQERKAGIKE